MLIDADCSEACTQKTTSPESESGCEASIAYEESPTQRFRRYKFRWPQEFTVSRMAIRMSLTAACNSEFHRGVLPNLQ